MGKNHRKHVWLVFTVMVTLIYSKLDHLAWDVCVAQCIRRMPPMPLPPGSDFGGVCLFFFFLIYLRGSVTDFWHLFKQPKYIYLCRRKSKTNNGFYYISTEIYSLKSHVVNFRSEICSGQSEERTTFFTCEKNRSSNQKLRTIFFHCIG